MRRYSRYKICKTNFHFFFFSSRLLNFNRPKWSVLKEKIENFKKTNKNKLQNKYKIRHSKFILPCFFNITRLFKQVNNLQEKKKIPVIFFRTDEHKHLTGFVNNNFLSRTNFEYLFLN